MHGGYHVRIAITKPEPQQAQASSSFRHSSVNEHAEHVPLSLFEPLPSHPPKPTARRYTFHHPRDQSVPAEGRGDYRFGRIRVDWVDFDMSSMDAKQKGSVGKEKERHVRGPASATFVPNPVRSKSGSTNLPEGVVHVYREVQKPKDDNAAASSSYAAAASQASKEAAEKSREETVHDSDGVMMGVLAVPSWMTPSDFLAFVAPAAEGMTHLRIIRYAGSSRFLSVHEVYILRRDSAPNRSIVVVKFRDASEAAEFAEAFNGKPFNSMEPEICHVVRILSVEIEADDTVSQTIARLGSPQTTTYELPTCPVCLERMDSAVTGLVTVPCSHTFHCACLSKWGDSRCPVCRYSQNLLSSHPTSPNTSRSTVPIPFTSPASSSQCADCPPDSPSTSNLWICLICGNIGCGRYRRAHAQAHYERTTHLYALELETQRVWDYAGDGYVHRLIQNKADGKLVELPSAASSMTMGGRGDGSGPSAADALSAEKIEAIGIEYSYLLTSQLDSQRTYYEQQTAELLGRMDELRGVVDTLSGEVQRTQAQLAAELAARSDAHDELVRAREKAEGRAERALALARKMEKEYRDEHALSERLSKNLSAAQERVERVEKEKTEMIKKGKELADQLQDVMFFLEARNKIESGEGVAAEAAGGSLEVSPAPEGSGRKKGRSPRKR
ncbi:hypothetical protein EIP86_005447 [Pleurotus ostreatoroseus]|nr:hypothetical protein EIP86_005447 [Pleurotus ostreatoroseus]